MKKKVRKKAKKKAVKKKPANKKKAKPKKKVAAKKTPPRKAARKTTKPKASKEARYCMAEQCRDAASLRGYCRLHYITNWKRIKLSEQIKAEDRLNTYVENLVKKYPKDYLEKIKEGLESEEKFEDIVDSMEESSLPVGDDDVEVEDEFIEKLARENKLGDE